MSKKITTMLWFICGIVFPILVSMLLCSYISSYSNVEFHTGMLVLITLYVGLPVLYITLIAIKKLCSLFSVSIGYMISIPVFYSLLAIRKNSFFPGMEHDLYVFFAVVFIVVTVILAIIDLVLQKRKRNKQLK